MKANKTSFLLLFICSSFLFFSCKEERPSTLPKYHMGETNEKGDTIFYTIPDYTFTNQDGKTITNKDYAGKIHIANFFFTSCPGICPIIMGELIRVQTAHKETKDLMFLSHSLDPANDTPAILKNYGERRGCDFARWNLVTGTPEAIHNMSREGYKLSAAWDNKAPGGINHTQRVTLIDKEGHIRGWYNGTNPDEVDNLIEDISLLSKEYE